jgi:excisionase family DNA binding protein
MAELPLVLTVEEAAKTLRIGRTAAYEAARRGDLPVIRLGRSIRVPRHALDQMLRGETPARDRRSAKSAETSSRQDEI